MATHAASSVAPEEKQSNAQPAGAGSYQSAAHIWHSDCGRKTRAEDVPEPEDLTQRPHHDEELNRDSDLSPAFSRHGENCSCIGQ